MLCFIAVEILTGAGAAAPATRTKTTAGVFGWPGGAWIVGIAGVVMIGVALYQGYRGVTKTFLKDSKTEEMSPGMKRWIARIGTVGHLARMVVFGLVGIFLIKAAVDFARAPRSASTARSRSSCTSRYGSYLLGIVAAGLIAFALYSLSDARYRRI